MNESQEEAVKMAFQKPLTVITGPPGTGKTQVVLNILANAIVQGKKVLVASKNNQAVDNVKDRFTNAIKESEYFLRFGSKEEMRGTTIDVIKSFVSKIHNNLYKKYQHAYVLNHEEIKKANHAIQNANVQLNKMNELLSNYIHLDNQYNKLQQQLIDFQNQNHEWADFSVNFPENELNRCLSKSNAFLNKIQTFLNGFFTRFLYKWFYKKNILKEFNQFIESLPTKIKNSSIFDSSNDTSSDEHAILKVCSQLSELLKNLQKLKNEILVKKKELDKFSYQMQKAYDEYKVFKNHEPELIKTIQENKQIIFKFSKPYVEAIICKRLNESRLEAINEYIDFIPDRISPLQKQARFEEVTKQFLNAFNVVAVTNLSVKNAFPLSTEIFDIVVIDEASQCDIISAIPLIYRAKQLVIIGDPLQLKHITSVRSNEDNYIQEQLKINDELKLNYVEQSLFDYCFNLTIASRLQSVILNEHFRCHPEIVGYSNKVFYGPKLGQDLVVLTDISSLPIPHHHGMFWIECSGKVDNNSNMNRDEVEMAVNLASELAQKYEQISIGITTPFKYQAIALNDAIPKNLKQRIKAATVHNFQGDEKDVMIVSLVVSDNMHKGKTKWINYSVPYLLNVAVTRARSALYIVGNKSYCKRQSAGTPLKELADYYDAFAKKEIGYPIKNKA